MAPRIVIVGAGPGGLTAGMLLAHRGCEVTILEAQPRIGGRNGEVELGPYRFDMGPTFLMMKFILDQVFVEAGRRAEDYLEFTRLSPMYRLIFSDAQLDMHDDPERMAQEMRKAFPQDADGIKKFMVEERERFARMLPCLQTDYATKGRMLNRHLRHALPKLSVGRSVYDVMGDYFSDPRARIAFTFQSKYLGMSPWECPGAFAIIPYVEHAYGIYHVKGGLCEIPRAMARVVGELGGSIRLGAPVRQVIVEKGAARGVILESGERIDADAVVLNADFGHAMTTLMPEGSTTYTRAALERKKWSCSTFMLYLGLDREVPLQHHTIVFAQDYAKNISSIFRGELTPDDLSFYVRNAAVSDPTQAPPGTSALYVLVPVPNLQGKADWAAQRDTMRAATLAQMERRLALPGLSRMIVRERIITPDDWSQDMRVFLGATFNLAHNLTQMLAFRPPNRSAEVERLYLVGGGTHPGSGLPTIYESGRISANMLCKDLGVPFHSLNVLT